MKYLFIIFSLLLVSSCTNKPKPMWIFNAAGQVKGMSIVNNSENVIVISGNRIDILNSKSGKYIKHVSIDDNEVNAIVCNWPFCIIGGGNHLSGYLESINFETGLKKRVNSSEQFAQINSIAIGRDDVIVTAHSDETLMSWGIKDLSMRKRLTLFDGLEVYSLRYFNGHFLAGNDGGNLIIWDGVSEKALKQVNPESKPIFAIEQIDGGTLVGGWEYLDFVDSDMSVKRHVSFKNVAVVSCSVSIDSTMIWCGLSDGSLVQIDVNGQRKFEFRAHTDSVKFVKILDNIIVTGSKDGTVKGWDISKLK